MSSFKLKKLIFDITPRLELNAWWGDYEPLNSRAYEWYIVDKIINLLWLKLYNAINDKRFNNTDPSVTNIINIINSVIKKNSSDYDKIIVDFKQNIESVIKSFRNTFNMDKSLGAFTTTNASGETTTKYKNYVSSINIDDLTTARNALLDLINTFKSFGEGTLNNAYFNNIKKKLYSARKILKNLDDASKTNPNIKTHTTENYSRGTDKKFDDNSIGEIFNLYYTLNKILGAYLENEATDFFNDHLPTIKGLESAGSNLIAINMGDLATGFLGKTKIPKEVPTDILIIDKAIKINYTVMENGVKTPKSETVEKFMEDLLNSKGSKKVVLTTMDDFTTLIKQGVGVLVKSGKGLQIFNSNSRTKLNWMDLELDSYNDNLLRTLKILYDTEWSKHNGPAKDALARGGDGFYDVYFAYHITGPTMMDVLDLKYNKYIVTQEGILTIENYAITKMIYDKYFFHAQSNVTLNDSTYLIAFSLGGYNNRFNSIL